MLIEGIQTTGYTNLKVSFEFAGNVAGMSYDDFTFAVNDVEMMPAGTLGEQNAYSLIEFDNIADASALKLQFISDLTGKTNQYGYRVDNIKIEGTTK